MKFGIITHMEQYCVSGAFVSDCLLLIPNGTGPPNFGSSYVRALYRYEKQRPDCAWYQSKREQYFYMVYH